MIVGDSWRILGGFLGDSWGILGGFFSFRRWLYVAVWDVVSKDSLGFLCVLLVLAVVKMLEGR